MNFFTDLASGGVTGLLKGVGTFAKDVRTAITGKESISSVERQALAVQADALETAVQSLESRAAQGQIDLNRIDAQSPSLFKGGWRPAIGWTCAFGLAYTFVIRTLLPWVVEVGCLLAGRVIELPIMPELDSKELTALTFSLLGFGGIRMYERLKGKV